MKNIDVHKEIKIEFPVGYMAFHKNEAFNFQLNRFYSFGYADYNDLMDIAKHVENVDDWKSQFLLYAKKMEAVDNMLRAAYYYRAAEFFMPPYDQEKAEIYNTFQKIIHSIMMEDGIEFIQVPYEEAFLPCLRRYTDQEKKKGDLLIHGGFDSYKEEFYSTMKYFTDKGYDVYVFEGPGQGEASRKFNLPIHHHWEKPTSTVLDYFALDDVTLLGMSMGGYLCFRAAAFDKRIKRLIASSVAYDYTDFPPKLLQPIVYLFYNVFKKYTANAILKVIKQKDIKSWYFANLQYMLKTNDPMDMVNFLTSMTSDELHCENITQDVLILTGRDDHACPFKMHDKQVKALIHANSVTDKVYYEETKASHHCQIGNIGLSFDDMSDWIDKIRGNNHVKN